MSKITLYTVHSSRGNNVRWMLAECGADYDTVALDYPQLKEADYLAINPMGKVPAIAHAGQVITELPAILTYLAELFPEKR
ncbi:MAG: glutathione S-transferase N-terminal domain-containing protein, partial [Eikenella corrodens]|uniref:glutathione S-transferase N-terminal domain-containing protein n=1 Tax=Eikenella corrodens TaxID=539 RepID=UPI00290F71E6